MLICPSANLWIRKTKYSWFSLDCCFTYLSSRRGRVRVIVLTAGSVVSCKCKILSMLSVNVIHSRMIANPRLNFFDFIFIRLTCVAKVLIPIALTIFRIRVVQKFES